MYLCLRAAAERPSSFLFPLVLSVCFFAFFWRASSRWFPPAGREISTLLIACSCSTPLKRQRLQTGLNMYQQEDATLFKISKEVHLENEEGWCCVYSITRKSKSVYSIIMCGSEATWQWRRQRAFKITTSAHNDRLTLPNVTIADITKKQHPVVL